MPAQRGRHRQQQPNSSQTIGIVALIAGCVVVLLFLLMSGGSGDEGDLAVAPQPRPEPVRKEKDPNEQRRNQARWWFEGTFFDDMGHQKKLSGQKIHELFEEAKNKGYPEALGDEWKELQEQVYRRLIKREKNDPDANRFYGRIPLSDYPDFFQVFRRMCDQKALPREFAELRDEYEGRVQYGPRWRTPAVSREEYARIESVLRRYEAHQKHMDENPTEQAIAEALARVKLHPLLGAYDTVQIERPPWVLFYADRDLTRKDDSEKERLRVERRKKELEGRLDAHTQLLNDYLAHFKEHWMKPLGLPDFEPRQLFFVWMFGDRETFDRYGAAIGQHYPPGVLGYFSSQTHWVYLYEPDKDRTQVEVSLAHELTHQLHWHFSKDDGQFDNHFERAKGSWLKEGWAEYVGWSRKEAGKFVFLQDAPGRMNLFHECRKHKLPIYPLQRLVKTENYSHYLRSIGIVTYGTIEIHKDSWLWNEMKKRDPKFQDFSAIGKLVIAEVYFGMLYSESWLFVKFLFEHDNGKYAEKAKKFLKATLKGYLGYRGARGYAQGHEVFAQIFGLKTQRDWDALQREFDGYLEAMLYRIPPIKK